MSIREIEVAITVNGSDVVAEIEYEVTSWGAPESGPSYSSGGEPAEPPEFEVCKITADNVNIKWDDISEEDQEKIDEAIYEELAEGPDDYYED